MPNNEQEPDVKISERVEVAPAGDDEETVDPTDSSQEDKAEEGKEDTEEKPESEEGTEEGAEAEPEADPAPEPQKNAATEDKADETGEIRRLPNETPREFALRLENKRLRGDLRKERSGEIFTAPTAAKPELSAEKKKVLEKYKPEDIGVLKEVFDVMADEMGFVRKDTLQATTYQEKAGEVLDTFLDKHPEYLPQNDPGNILWNRFKEEFGLYKTPANTRDLKKVLDKIHKDVFGIKPAAALNKQDAAKEKIKVASHSGSSRPIPSKEGVKRANAPTQGLRTDMLKGFSDEEIAELQQG